MLSGNIFYIVTFAKVNLTFRTIYQQNQCQKYTLSLTGTELGYIHAFPPSLYVNFLAFSRPPFHNFSPQNIHIIWYLDNYCVKAEKHIITLENSKGSARVQKKNKAKLLSEHNISTRVSFYTNWFDIALKNPDEPNTEIMNNHRVTTRTQICWLNSGL